MKKSLLFIVLAALTLNVFAQIPTNGLIAYYAFSGNANDQSGNSNNGTVTNATLTSDRFGNANSAYSFNGSSVITVNNSTTLKSISSNYSISVWTKISAFNGSGQFPIIDKDTLCPPTSGKTPFLFVANNISNNGYDIQNIECGVANQYAKANVNAQTGTWTHTVATYDGSNIKFYVDGALKSTTPATGNVSMSNAKMTIGHTVFGAGNSWANGIIDDIRVYNTAITANNVTALYNETPSCLVAHYPFTGNANDASGNSNDGTVSNAVLTTDRFGVANSAYLFNGTSQITIPYSANFNFGTSANFTTSAWIKISSFSDYFRNYLSYACADNQGLGGFQLTVSEGAGNPLYYEGSNSFSQSGGGISDQNWHNTVTVFDRTKDSMFVYLDKTLIGKAYINPAYSFTPACNPSIRIGGERNGQTIHYFKGSIDDVRIYNCILNGSEINSLFYEGICKQSISVTDTLIINMNTTGFNPISYSNAIKIYPNPANDQLNVSIANGNNNGYQIKIINTLSQVMWSQTITGSTYSISLSGFSAGTYFVHVYDGQSNLVEVKKLILQ